jgi:hypothetical protein
MIGPPSDKSPCARELAARVLQCLCAVKNRKTQNLSVSRTRKEKCQTSRRHCRNRRVRDRYYVLLDPSGPCSTPFGKENRAWWPPSRLTCLTARVRNVRAASEWRRRTCPYNTNPLRPQHHQIAARLTSLNAGRGLVFSWLHGAIEIARCRKPATPRHHLTVTREVTPHPTCKPAKRTVSVSDHLKGAMV